MKYLLSSILILILIFPQNILAHPNTTINYRIFFKFDKLNVTDIGENWTFDKITSQELISKYNLGKKRKLNKKESIDIGKKVMDGLLELRYFTYILVDSHDLGTIKASGFKAQIKNGILSVAFNNHLPFAVDTTKQTLKVQVKDIDSTIITKLAKRRPVILIGASTEYCKITIEEKRRRHMPLGQDLYTMDMFLPPKEIGVTCEDKKLQ